MPIIFSGSQYKCAGSGLGEAEEGVQGARLRRARSLRAAAEPALEREASNFMPWEPHFPLLNPDPANTRYCSSI